MSVIGIDLNSRKVALSKVKSDGSLALAKWSVSPKVKDRAAIVAQLYLWTHELVVAGDEVYVEAPIVAGVRNLQSTIKIAAAYGAVLAAVNMKDAVAHDVAVSSWKLATVGKGNASKSDVSNWLNTTHPDVHTECSGDQDLIDASCIALFGHQDWSTRLSERHLHHQAPPAASAGHGRSRD